MYSFAKFCEKQKKKKKKKKTQNKGEKSIAFSVFYVWMHVVLVHQAKGGRGSVL